MWIPLHLREYACAKIPVAGTQELQQTLAGALVHVNEGNVAVARMIRDLGGDDFVPRSVILLHAEVAGMDLVSVRTNLAQLVSKKQIVMRRAPE